MTAPRPEKMAEVEAELIASVEWALTEGGMRWDPAWGASYQMQRDESMRWVAHHRSCGCAVAALLLKHQPRPRGSKFTLDDETAAEFFEVDLDWMRAVYFEINDPDTRFADDLDASSRALAARVRAYGDRRWAEISGAR